MLGASHPHVVDLYAVIETADNVYIVMELVEVQPADVYCGSGD